MKVMRIVSGKRMEFSDLRERGAAAWPAHLMNLLLKKIWEQEVQATQPFVDKYEIC